MSGDTFVGRNVGAMGPNASAHGTTFNEYSSAMAQGFDVAVLAAELGALKGAMKEAANDTGQLESVAAVSAAEDAAKKGDGATAFSKLKAAGSWALDTATKIGVSVAAEAIKKASGLG